MVHRFYKSCKKIVIPREYLSDYFRISLWTGLIIMWKYYTIFVILIFLLLRSAYTNSILLFENWIVILYKNRQILFVKNAPSIITYELLGLELYNNHKGFILFFAHKLVSNKTGDYHSLACLKMRDG